MRNAPCVEPRIGFVPCSSKTSDRTGLTRALGVVDAMLQVGEVLGKNVVEADRFGEIDVPHRPVSHAAGGLAFGWRYETKSTGLRLVVTCPRAAEERERSAKSVLDTGVRRARSPERPFVAPAASMGEVLSLELD